MSKAIVLKLFQIVDVVTFDWNYEKYDIKVIDDTFYDDLLNYKTLGFGEAYMNKKFTTPNLEILLTKLQKINKFDGLRLLKLLRFQDYIYFLRYIIFKFITLLISIFTNPQSILKSKEVAEIHYDLPTQLYEKMLDPSMLYSCAYWDECKTLEEAQIKKTELVIRKLKIQDGDSVLEIGSGWGFIAYNIAKRFPKCKVQGISISKEQIDYCNIKYNLNNLEFVLQDYRELQHNVYDKIYSVGMFEHIGAKNYDDFFGITYRLLKNNGIMLAHTITKHKEGKDSDPWINKYIFPGGYLPSIGQVIKVSEKTNYTLCDVQEFGNYYTLTLQSWLQSFRISFPELQEEQPEIFTSKFQRMWELYLIMSKVGFTSKHLHLAQFVFTKNYDGVYIR